MYCKTLYVILFLRYLSHVIAFPERTDLNSPSLSGILTALRRSAEPDTYSRELNCHIDMAGIPGEYYYTSQGHEDMCVIYFLAAEDEIVEIEFTEANFDCEAGDHVQWFDGWTMGTGSFPSYEDHPLNLTERVQTVCPGEGRPMTFRSNQNAAMMTFKLTSRGSSLKIVLETKQILEPCNVLAQDPSGMYTIRNYGANRNCSFSVIYPIHVSVVEMAIGQEQNEATLKCTESEDYVEFLAGNYLDNSYMRQDAILCGAAGHVNSVVSEDRRSGAAATSPNTPHTPPLTDVLHLSSACTHGLNINLNCQNSVVRLVSGGNQDNSLTIEYRRSLTGKNDCELSEY
ncbi:corticotropin-releasing factor-binding protein-like isoform X2 [Apostichopus japonicus]|uniref:corticotropin-releasing factor-binding protein-like isoform X2 n=1 Tax=Stichopus japonicus TaxID=307972 RepID=UPI003AB786DE